MPAFRSVASTVSGALLLLFAACTAQESAPAPDAGPVPVGFRLALAGDTGPVLDAEGRGQFELARDGADAPVSAAFENGGLTVHELAPGRYEITGLGSLQCRGLAFEVGAEPRYLGAVSAELVRANYHVALMSRPSVPVADVAALAEAAGVEPDAVNARPLDITESAPCFLGRDGPVITWDDLTLGEKIMLGVGVAGLCAASLAAGGFCQF